MNLHTSCRFVIVMALVAVAAPLGGCASNAQSRKGGWTILCTEIQGPNRMQIAESVAESLKATPGVRGEAVFVRDGPDEVARIYYGDYDRPIDSDTERREIPPDLRKDIDYIKGLGTEDGRRLFLGAMSVRTPQRDVGDPAWDLRRADGVYTLQVAAFEPTDSFRQYKQAAADYCALLRGQGHEAYYYHDRSSSIVTVGLFGEDAVVIGADGRSYYSQAVRELQQHDALEHNLVNGHIYKVRADDGSFVAMPSRLVQLPEESESSPW